MQGRTLKKRQRLVLLPRVRPLAVARAATGKTIQEMADETGLSYWQLTHLLNGSTYSNQYAEKMARKIAEYFGCSLEELFFAVDLENPDDATAA